VRTFSHAVASNTARAFSKPWVRKGTATIDTELVRRCRAGDEGAFRQLVETYHDRVYRTAYAVTGDVDTAAEVVQETYLKAWRGLAWFRGEASLATWLTRLAVHTGTDYLRRRRRRALLPPVLALLRREHQDAVQAFVDRDEVQRALDRLPADVRQVVALRFGLDLSVKDIALVLGCPEGTVKSRLHRALERLRTIITQERTPVAPGGPVEEVSHGQR